MRRYKSKYFRTKSCIEYSGTYEHKPQKTRVFSQNRDNPGFLRENPGFLSKERKPRLPVLEKTWFFSLLIENQGFLGFMWCISAAIHWSTHIEVLTPNNLAVRHMPASFIFVIFLENLTTS